MINKIIHLIWLQGFDNLPDIYKPILQNNQKVLHDYQFIFWDDKNIRKLLTTSYNELITMYDACKIYQAKSDIARYCIIHSNGGIYADVDFKFYKKIDLFLKKDFICVIFGQFKILNGFFGSIKKHVILDDIIHNLSKNTKIIHKMNITFITGTIMFKKYITKNQSTKVLFLPPIYFHPVSKNNINHKIDTKYIYSQEIQFEHTTYSWFNDYMSLYYNVSSNVNNFIDTLSLQNYNKKIDFNSDMVIKKNTNNTSIILLVAHPDDELLFFGNILQKYKEKIKVISITNASNETRKNEFISSLEKFNILNYEMWDYTDMHSYYISSKLKEQIKKAINGYNKVYTHSLSGETGHPQHIGLYKAIHDQIDVLNNQKLYVPLLMNKYENFNFNNINLLCNEYKSQSSAKFLNIFNYFSQSHIRIL